jgi:hypothetical protein
VTPMIAAVLEKFLVVEVESFGSLVAEVRSDERNMGVNGLWGGFDFKDVLREKVMIFGVAQ